MPFGSKKGTPWTKAAHIKKGTHGSSNEISVSVLDAARNTLDSEQGEAPRQKLGVINLFTLNGKASANIAVPSSTLVNKNVSPDDASAPPAKVEQLVEPSLSKEERDAQKKEQREQQRAARKAQKQAKEQAKLEAAQARQEKAQAKAEKKAKKEIHGSHVAASQVVSMPRKNMEERIAQKKARRRLRRIGLVVAVVIVSLAAVGVSVSHLYKDYQDRQEQIAILDKGLNQITIADNDLAKLNTLLENPSVEGAQDTINELRSSLPTAQVTLHRAESLIENGLQSSLSDEDREVANQAVKAIKARETMIEKGLALMDCIESAFEATDVVNKLWNDLLEADAQARKNASLLLNPTEENLDTALAGIDTSKKAFSQVKVDMVAADEAYSYINLTQYEAYIDKRMESFDSAAKAIEALKDEDLDAARSYQAAYSAADTEASTLASKLPKQISSVVEESYSAAIKDLVDQYTTARTTAGGADEILRSFYGSQQK